MKSILLFIFLFFNIYQIKVYNLELTMFINFFLLFFIIRKKVVKLRRYEYLILGFAFFLCLYSVLTSLLNGNWNLFLYGRNFRMFLSSIFLILLTKHYIISKVQFINVLKTVLFINIASIIIQNFWPETKMLFASLVGYDKKMLDLRSFGLFSSYDVAGFYSLFCLLLFGFFPNTKSKFISVLCTSCSFLACFFTSRLTMILCIIFLIIFLYLNRKKIKLVHLAIVAPLIYYFLLKFGNLVFLIIIMSLPSLSESLGLSYLFDTSISDSYGSSSADILVNEMSGLPPDQYIFFGEGIAPSNSDIGYVHLLFMYGLIGAFFILLFYIYMIYKSASTLKMIGDKDLLNFYLLFSFLLFVFNYKLTFITARGTHELFIILVIFISTLKLDYEHKLYIYKFQ